MGQFSLKDFKTLNFPSKEGLNVLFMSEFWDFKVKGCRVVNEIQECV